MRCKDVQLLLEPIREHALACFRVFFSLAQKKNQFPVLVAAMPGHSSAISLKAREIWETRIFSTGSFFFALPTFRSAQHSFILKKK